MLQEVDVVILLASDMQPREHTFTLPKAACTVSALKSKIAEKMSVCTTCLVAGAVMGYSTYSKDGGAYVYKTFDDTHLLAQSRMRETVWVFEALDGDEPDKTMIQVRDTCVLSLIDSTFAGCATKEVNLSVRYHCQQTTARLPWFCLG